MRSTNGHVDLEALPIERRTWAIRKALGMRQIDFADEVGVNVRQVKRWESGSLPSEESAQAIAAAVPRKLGVKPELLYVPRERREERILDLEARVEQLERRLKKAGL